MSHQRIDQRSLAFGKEIARRLPGHPEHLARARSNIARWMTTCSPGVKLTLEEWQETLDGSLEGVIALLTGTDERATRLRQSNPFAGVLTQEERNAIIRQYANS